jgi:hypothetical protein
MSSFEIPPNVKQEMERLREPGAPVNGGPDLRWAHRIMERHRAGELIRAATLRMAREALAQNGQGDAA